MVCSVCGGAAARSESWLSMDWGEELPEGGRESNRRRLSCGLGEGGGVDAGAGGPSRGQAPARPEGGRGAGQGAGGVEGDVDGDSQSVRRVLRPGSEEGQTGLDAE